MSAIFDVPRLVLLVTWLMTLILFPLTASKGNGIINDGDKLWQIVNQCQSHQTEYHEPRPCVRINQQQDYVLLKDLNGRLQYLLLPIQPVTGIESPLLLKPSTTNYFAAAWHNRDLLSQHYGQKIADDVLSLAINSKYGRTQNQLHIHISCINPDIRQQLWKQYPQLTEQWKPVTGDIKHHSYWARKINIHDLTQSSPFMLLANGMDAAKNDMGKYALALLVAPDNNFILLTTRVQLLSGNLASIEEIQDHDCHEIY